MAANSLQSFDAVAQDVPTVAVAAIFQKDPQVFLAHPEAGVKKLDDLKPLTLFVSKEGMAGYYKWLKSEHGFSDDKVKPYTFNAQPFLADTKSAMQGYVTSEPFAVEKLTGKKPTILLLADYGFEAYSTLIETRRDLVDKKPDLVQRFVDASIIGWYTYLYGDNAPGNAMIKKLNPEMTDELIAYSDMKDRFAADPNFISPRSALIATYALCGFANFASVGIQVGGISTLAPARRHDLSRIGLLAMVGGAIASFMGACVVGVLM